MIGSLFDYAQELGRSADSFGADTRAGAESDLGLYCGGRVTESAGDDWRGVVLVVTVKSLRGAG